MQADTTFLPSYWREKQDGVKDDWGSDMSAVAAPWASSSGEGKACLCAGGGWGSRARPLFSVQWEAEQTHQLPVPLARLGALPHESQPSQQSRVAGG